MATERKYILLVDDEKNFCDLVKLNLEMSGKFKVITAYDGEEGLKKAKSENPDVILLDIRMPKIDGFEMLKILKKDSQTMPIPVIMLSAVDDDTSKIKSSGMMSEYYITKPVKTDELIAKIEWVLQLRGS